MSYALSDTVTTPGGNGTPLYRVSTSACEYNAYTDSTGCSCVIYTDPNNDFFTVCQTDSAQTAYFWTGRDDCLATHTEGANVKLIDQNGHVDSTTGSQFCTGVFASDPQVLQTVLSMPVGPDVNIAASVSSSTSTAAASSSTSSSSNSGDWTTNSFTGLCICKQTMCSAYGCGSTQYHTLDGEVDRCTSGTTSVAKQDGGHYGCFVDNSNNEESLICECKAVVPGTSSASSASSVPSTAPVSSLPQSTSLTRAGFTASSPTTIDTLVPTTTVSAVTTAPTISSSGGGRLRSRKADKLGCLLLVLLGPVFLFI